jgi:hypothetical protein
MSTAQAARADVGGSVYIEEPRADAAAKRPAEVDQTEP